MDTDRIWQGFIRQRRNLIIVSLVLLLVHAEELTFTKLSLFGNVTELKSQATILVILWTCWAYWIIRYYQYYRDIGDQGYKLLFSIKLDTLVSEFAKRTATKSAKLNAEEADITKYHDLIAGDFENIKAYKTYREGNVNVFFRKADGSNIKHITIPIKLNFTQLLVSTVRSVVHVMVNTTLFTEYVLPFIIALFPFIYAIIKVFILNKTIPF